MEKEKRGKRALPEAPCDLSTKPILSEREACIFLNVCRQTLYELRISGKIGYCKAKGQDKKLPAIRYRREHLLNYIKDNYDEVKPLKMRYR